MKVVARHARNPSDSPAAASSYNSDSTLLNSPQRRNESPFNYPSKRAKRILGIRTTTLGIIAITISLIILFYYSAKMSFSLPDWTEKIKLEKKDKYPKQTTLKTRINYQDFAVAVKTGKETSLNRVPEQLITFLKTIENVMYLGESPNIMVGDIQIHDVCSTLYDKYQSKPEEWETNLKKLSAQVTLKPTKNTGDSLVPDNDSVGWKFDAHKNLPGFVLLYKTYPNAKWYVMIDDDTYIFMTNLDLFLDGLSHLDDHYFGSSTMFTGCDNVSKFGDGPGFAQYLLLI